MRIARRKTKSIKIGKAYIGGSYPVLVQSMAKTETADYTSTIKQIKGLESTGCEVVRVSVKDSRDAKAIRKIKNNINIPLVADIHFHWRLAIEAIDSGVDKIRLNPGNIYKKRQLREIAKAAKLAGIPIRVGVNSGSLPRAKSQEPRAKSASGDIMVRGALDYIRMLEGFGFSDIVVSLKASNIFDTIEAYRKMARLCDYPFHLGITATGALSAGVIKSSIVLGNLLLEGIGDTIRVSICDNPRHEVKVGRSILEAVGLRHFGPEVISCPTCGRCTVDLVKLVKEFEDKLNTVRRKPILGPSPSLKVAIMGCCVNGPGEASEADVGIAFGKREGLLFKKGRVVKKVNYKDCIDELIKGLGVIR